MVYIGADGNVAQKRTPWRLSIVTDTFIAIFDMIGLLFRSLTNPPDRNAARRTNYTERQASQRLGGDGSGTGSGKRQPRKGSNIRNLKNLGVVDAQCGGGG